MISIFYFIFTGAYHNKTDLNGRVLTDHMLFGTIVATTLVIVVTAQVNFESGFLIARSIQAENGGFPLTKVLKLA